MTSETPEASRKRHQALAVATAFFALFSIVGFAFYGLPFFYDFFVKELGWSRAQVTSGNAFAKLVIGPLFGFFAGVFVDRFGPRRSASSSPGSPRSGWAAPRRSSPSTRST